MSSDNNNNKVSITVALSMPAPHRERPARPHLSVEDRIRNMLDLIDSGHESYVEWRTIQKLYQKLCSMKQTPRVQNAKKMIEPILSKFGYHKISGE